MRWKDFAELQETENTLLNVGRNLEWACSILQRCEHVSQNIDQHRLYQALNILEDIQQQMRGPTPSPPTAPPQILGLDDATSTSEVLQNFLKEILNDLRNIIQQMAVADFNDWLVMHSMQLPGSESVVL